MPIEFKIANRRFNFLRKLNLIDGTYCKYFDPKNEQLFNLAKKYGCEKDGLNIYNGHDSRPNLYVLQNLNFNLLLRKYFELSLEQFL